jgi:hypothetical protein
MQFRCRFSLILTVGVVLAWTSPDFSLSCPAAFLIDLSCSARLGELTWPSGCRCGTSSVGSGCRPTVSGRVRAALWFGGGIATTFLTPGRGAIGSDVPDPAGRRSCERCPVALGLPVQSGSLRSARRVLFVAVTDSAVRDEEQEQLRLLMRELSLVDQWLPRIEGGRRMLVAAGSPLAGDDRWADPFQMSHAVSSALVVAVDHAHCLRRAVDGCADCAPDEVTLLLNSYYSCRRSANSPSEVCSAHVIPPACARHGPCVRS